MTPRILLIIGPTAVGKSTLIDRALVEFPMLHDLITCTTRAMRAGEKEGQPYHFISESQFKALIEKKALIEWATVHGNMYGTPWDQFHQAAAAGKVIIIDVDVQGAKRIRQQFPQAVTVFIKPPTMDALRKRFIKRGVTNEADLTRRLETAQTEMSQAEDFQHQVVNDDFDSAYSEVRKIIEKLLKNQ